MCHNCLICTDSKYINTVTDCIIHVHFHFQTEVGPIFSLTNLPWDGPFCNSNPIGGGLEESS